MTTCSTLSSTQNRGGDVSTSACGSMRSSAKPTSPVIGGLLYYSGTTNAESIPNLYLCTLAKQTASDIPVSFISSDLIGTSQAAVNELRRLSGLTWEQLAKILNVSRRSLHFWASGKPLSPFNEELLRRLLGTIQYINRGSVSENRSLLLHPVRDSSIPLDLLIAGKYEEIKQLLGAGKVSEKPKLKSLSSESIALRMPQRPEDLVDARHEPIHREVGRSRPARTTRSQRRSGS
jgi:transcriptional regulator with XRE-family HTH domain